MANIPDTSVSANISSKPKVSVVTVVLNSRDLIEATIESVLAQSYKPLEYVIVDGGSTDGTLDIIEKYRGRIDVLVVEKDKGIYDAMNKSARLANGDYIIFMNSGDEFVGPDTVQTMCNCVTDDQALVYGGWIVKYPWGLERTGMPVPIENIWQGMFVQHQSVMVKTAYMRSHPFDMAAGLGADYAFLLDLIHSGERYAISPVAVSRVAAGGASDNNRMKVLRSHWRQSKKYYPSRRTDIHYIVKLTKHYLADFVKSIIPENAVRYIIGRKR